MIVACEDIRIVVNERIEDQMKKTNLWGKECSDGGEKNDRDDMATLGRVDEQNTE